MRNPVEEQVLSDLERLLEYHIDQAAKHEREARKAEDLAYEHDERAVVCRRLLDGLRG